MIDRCARAAALLLGLASLTSTAQAHSTYKVNWRVISADTHKVKGFTFHVRP